MSQQALRWEGVIQAGPRTVLDHVRYQPMDEFWGNDSIAVTVHVLNQPAGTW